MLDVHCRVHKCLALIPVNSYHEQHEWSPYSSTPHYWKQIINITFPPTPQYSNWPLPFKFSIWNLIYMSSLSHVCYMPCSSHSPLLNHPNNIQWKTQQWHFSFAMFLQSPITSFLSSLKYHAQMQDAVLSLNLELKYVRLS